MAEQDVTNTNVEQKTILPSDKQLIAGKYADENAAIKGTIEAGVKKYGSLEAFYKATAADLKPVESTPKPEDNKPAGEEGNTETNPVEDEDLDKLQKAGINLEELTSEYNETGNLSEESYKKLEKAGFDRGYIDTYKAGLNAQIEMIKNAMAAETDGEDNYRSMVDWMQSNLSKQELDAYEESFKPAKGATFEQYMENIKGSIKNMYTRYIESEGQPPTGLIKGGVASQTTGVYQSMEEMTIDMRDPRYKTSSRDYDPAFAAKVKAKIEASVAAGTLR